MTLFTDAELETLDKAARILASKRIQVAKELQSKHPECYAAALLSRTRGKIDMALAKYPNWREVATLLLEV